MVSSINLATNIHCQKFHTQAAHVQFYRYYDGIIRNGLSALIFFFADAGPEDGGFVCVPGSHKSNFLSYRPPRCPPFLPPPFPIVVNWQTRGKGRPIPCPRSKVKTVIRAKMATEVQT